MTDADFRFFIRAIRTSMQAHGQDVDVLEVEETAQKARLPLPGGEWFTVDREHLDVVGGTPAEIAAAVYAVYQDDVRGITR